MAIDPSPELERISCRLAAEKGIDEDRRLELLDLYLVFLSDAARSREPAFPSLAVDEIWHRHILDTQSYARDCSQWFGTFIHHQPDSVPDESVQRHRTLADCSAQDPAPCSGIGAILADCSAPQDPPPCKAIAAVR